MPVVPRKKVAGVRIVHDDADIVVIDKPAGVAAHPSLGWDGPSVTEHLAAAGFRISTSGAAERQGVVQRLDVGTSGLMVVAKSERAYTLLKRAFRDHTVDKVYHALVQGFPDPHVGTIDPIGRHPGHDWKMAIIDGGRHSVTHYDTLEVFAAPPCSRCTWRPGTPIRSGCTARRSDIPASATRSTAATRCWPASWGWSGNGCTPSNSASNTPAAVSRCGSIRPTPMTWLRGVAAGSASCDARLPDSVIPLLTTVR